MSVQIERGVETPVVEAQVAYYYQWVCRGVPLLPVAHQYISINRDAGTPCRPTDNNTGKHLYLRNTIPPKYFKKVDRGVDQGLPPIS